MPRTSPAKPFSIRMSELTMDRLDLHARRRGEAKSRTAERLIDEGLRMQEHAGVVFRDGAAGRRAALAGGPDVWEVIETLKGTGCSGEQAIERAARWGNLSHAQVRTAMHYYADFSEEIDERVELNRLEAERGRTAWERAQDALA
jgi:hypothetical protein